MPITFHVVLCLPVWCPGRPATPVAKPKVAKVAKRYVVGDHIKGNFRGRSSEWAVRGVIVRCLGPPSKPNKMTYDVEVRLPCHTPGDCPSVVDHQNRPVIRPVIRAALHLPVSWSLDRPPLVAIPLRWAGRGGGH